MFAHFGHFSPYKHNTSMHASWNTGWAPASKCRVCSRASPPTPCRNRTPIILMKKDGSVLPPRQARLQPKQMGGLEPHGRGRRTQKPFGTLLLHFGHVGPVGQGSLVLVQVRKEALASTTLEGTNSCLVAAGLHMCCVLLVRGRGCVCRMCVGVCAVPDACHRARNPQSPRPAGRHRICRTCPAFRLSGLWPPSGTSTQVRSGSQCEELSGVFGVVQQKEIMVSQRAKTYVSSGVTGFAHL